MVPEAELKFSAFWKGDALEDSENSGREEKNKQGWLACGERKEAKKEKKGLGSDLEKKRNI